MYNCFGIIIPLLAHRTGFTMKRQQLKASLLLLLAAGIWGLAFVAQKTSTQYIGPFAFNGIRFMLGSLSLLPLIILFNKNASVRPIHSTRNEMKHAARAGFTAGLILFGGSTLQQIGLIYTSAGKAAFITGLYIVIVPLLGLFLKQRFSLNIGFGAIIAAIGLYSLSITHPFSIGQGDLIELIGALFWSVHILMIDKYSRHVDILKLSFFQMLTSSIISLVVALFTETIAWSAISQALIPILYGGILSAGVAYTLQIVGQKHAQPAQAAIILSLEAVFAALGGYLLLHEHMSTRGLMGCLLMLIGMLLPQLPKIRLLRPPSDKKSVKEG
jgi:drug/metabolite transporter (DMT)-like permease